MSIRGECVPFLFEHVKCVVDCLICLVNELVRVIGVFSEDINKSCKDALSNRFHWCYDLIKFGLVALSLECFALLDKLVIVRVEIPVALFTEVLGLTHESLNDD